VSTLSKARNFVQHRCQKNGNNVEAPFDFVERVVRLVAFDNVASTLLLVWTRLDVTVWRGTTMQRIRCEWTFATLVAFPVEMTSRQMTHHVTTVNR